MLKILLELSIKKIYHVRVNSYGSMVPLNQVATVTTPDARPSKNLTPGEDYGTYPLARTYMFGLNLTL